MDDLERQVRASFDRSGNDRFRMLMQSLTAHLHAFLWENDVTIEEWYAGVDFLTRTGRTCSETRQEFVLLSDVLGASMLVEVLAEGRGEGVGATERTVLGPFHMTTSPERELGSSIAGDAAGERLLVYGRVSDTAGGALPSATVDVWQANGEGYYDVQLPDVVPQGSGRGLFTTNSAGWFYFETVVPAPYPIPSDGPVGELLAAASRPVYRPAHIHFQVSAAGCRELTTHIFLADSPHLDSDAVFAVRPGLVRQRQAVDGDRGDLADLVVDPDGPPVPSGAEALRVDLVLALDAQATSRRSA
ncbi:6-chlorohydroxyquinol-1,2-dioxygenase [Streptomyces sp. PRh5]|nr:6-chlorohydroxyquinol-1,2-dioxygenase [Streptomyces sp. PRh5]TMV00304.1 6-chlorohydroxyquinol-1,2-dioxygenase [Streptomyces sp. DASNCL29]